jgi:hypothetical protein
MYKKSTTDEGTTGMEKIAVPQRPGKKPSSSETRE